LGPVCDTLAILYHSYQLARSNRITRGVFWSDTECSKVLEM
jgi:hypothetical protein